MASLQWRVRRIVLGSTPLGRLEAVGHAACCWPPRRDRLCCSCRGAMGVSRGIFVGGRHGDRVRFLPPGVVQRPYTGRIVATCAFRGRRHHEQDNSRLGVFGRYRSRSRGAPRSHDAAPARPVVETVVRSGHPDDPRHDGELGEVPSSLHVPIDHQVFTMFSSHRRAAIAANGGDLISLSMIPSTVVNYFSPFGIRFIRIFPFITLPPNLPVATAAASSTSQPDRKRRGRSRRSSSP